MKLLTSTLLFVSFIRFAAVASAADPLGATPVPVRPLTPHPTSIPTIVSLNADSITIQNGIFTTKRHSDADKQKDAAANTHTYKVTKFTEITINGHRKQLSDLKPGMQVHVTAGTDPAEASIIAGKVDRSELIPAH